MLIYKLSKEIRKKMFNRPNSAISENVWAYFFFFVLP